MQDMRASLGKVTFINLPCLSALPEMAGQLLFNAPFFQDFVFRICVSLLEVHQMAILPVPFLVCFIQLLSFGPQAPNADDLSKHAIPNFHVSS